MFSLDSEEEFDPSELKLLPVLASGRASTQIAQQQKKLMQIVSKKRTIIEYIDSKRGSKK